MHKNLVFCLMGPSAVGKTAIAAELVQRFPMEIVSIDSAMIYRGMDIGSAKPNAPFLARAPHHLIDILDPPETYSAAQCCDDVETLCEAITQRGNIPLLTGGTMMYFNAIQQGLSSLPHANASIRKDILKRAMEHGWTHMHRQLALVDPLSAERIHPNDTQRIQRALEVFAITQIPLSTLWLDTKTNPSSRFINLAIMPHDRSWLHARIADRFQQMIADGLIEETKQLIHMWSLTAEHPSMKCVGYRQVFHYLQGEYDEKHLLEKGIAATRQLAKRQLTWLRHWPEKTIFTAEDVNIIETITAAVQQLLNTAGQIS